MKKLVIVFFFLFVPALARSADFFCADVTCLAAAINESNQNTAEGNRIFLQAETFTLQTPLPFIGPGGVEIVGSLVGLPSTIERHPEAEPFSIFQATGQLRLVNITIKGGDPFGIFFAVGNLSLNSVTLTENRLGLAIGDGHADVKFTTISFNGQGIGTASDGTVSLFSALFEHNQVPLGLGGFSAAEVRNTTFRDNESGIITSFPIGLVLTDSAFIRNRGGITTGGRTTIENTTVAFNESQDDHGAISCRSGTAGFCAITILNSTITSNRGRFAGGITVPGPFFPPGTIELQNSIVSGNKAEEGSNPDCDTGGFPERIRSLGNNIVGSCSFLQAPSDMFGDPGLAAFVDDDTPGRSHFPLRFDSLAVDSANPEACPPTDQLGNPRVGICDIGSIEFQGRLPVVIDIRPKSDANRINPSSTKDINVAIFSVNGFDATSVDSNTVRFGATGSEAAPIHVGRRDVDGDGQRDMVLRFQIPDTGIACGDTSASLTGQTFQGLSIIGSSPIKTVQCKQQKVSRN